MSPAHRELQPDDPSTREAQRLQPPLAAVAEGGFVERRLAMFDAIGDIPTLALTALLALDDDKGYEPLPFLDATRQSYQTMVDAGKLPADLDIEAAHLVTLATSIGVAICATPAVNVTSPCTVAPPRGAEKGRDDEG